jgi:hypothetical protein
MTTRRKAFPCEWAAISFLAVVCLWSVLCPISLGQSHQSLPNLETAAAKSHKIVLEPKDIATLTFSLLAFGVSMFTLWRTYLSPYKLVITSPVITQFPDLTPSLAVDLGFTNLGARTALVSDIRIRPHCNGEPIPIELRAQRSLERFAANFGLPQQGTDKAALFLAFTVKAGESKSDRIYFSLYEDKPFAEADILRINSLLIDVKINGVWKKAVFSLGYEGYRDKFIGNGIIDVPEKGFWPYFYSHIESRQITGGFWL